jgi:ferredoxin
MGFKIVVDYDSCESNAVCMGIAPEHFEVRDDDFLYVLQEGELSESDRPLIQQAVDMCPKQAISIEDV